MKYLIALLVMIFLVGCQGLADWSRAQQERKRAAIESRCDSYGFQPSTTAYSNCLMSETQRAQDQEAQKRAADEKRRKENLKALEPPKIDTTTTTCYQYGRQIQCTSN